MRLRLLTSLVLVLGLLLAAAPTAALQDEPQPVTPEWGPVDSSPIRPGSDIPGCTMNFVFHDEVFATEEDPDPEVTVYIGTAAHCVNGSGQEVRVTGAGTVGEVVYDSDEHNTGSGLGVDFALIELYPEMVSLTNPTMRHWGGPVGSVTAEEVAFGDRVNVYGYGVGVGLVPPARPRFGFVMASDDDEYVVNMPAVNGDSGAPLLHHETGKALGIISRYGFAATPPSTDTGPMMPWIFRELERAGFGDVVLATATD